MRFNLAITLVGLLICLLIDIRIYKIIKHRCHVRKSLYTSIHITSSLLSFIALSSAIYTSRHPSDNALIVTMWLIFIFITTLFPKILFLLFDTLAIIPRLINRNRLSWISRIGVIMSVMLFATMWWGALINRNRISVTEWTVKNDSWPDTFNGLRIAHISDLHTGTWGHDTTFIARLVTQVNELKPDIILFTGDIVNRKSDEFEPMLNTFKRLNAPLGVYAVLGNHDYGDYNRWPDEASHAADIKNLKHLYAQSSHRLLLNETVYIKKGSDSIALIGVENIGEPPFATYGNLSMAYPNLNDSTPKILMTHNPTHWVNDIKNNNACNIGLTLSGHTHAMQIQIAGHTPSSWRYETPWGLYTDSLNHALIVNRGAGTVGLPMRIGATPEISLITLQR